MINRIDQRLEDLVQLTIDEMDRIQGGDVVPTDQFSLNFATIEFEYKPSTAASDSEYKYVSVRR